MQTRIIQQHLSTYRQWKARVARSVRELEGWLGVEGELTDENRQRIRNSLRALQDNRMSIAFVGEFSRGKAELINAIFFADYKRRLLPTAADRTTMCPTELLWDDERNEAYLRLLPIETRGLDTPISELKKDTKRWVHYPLQIQDPSQMASTISEIQQRKRISIGEATRLGLSSFGSAAHEGHLAPRQIEVPKWRYAVLSFPHPLFKQGLSILDTPGLSALGSEPELTSNILPTAQALLFVLAADSGVTRSDLELWQHHLKGFQNERQRSITVALNKSDILWDYPQDLEAKETEVIRRRTSTAMSLGIAEEAVLPVSAQKGFQGKVDHNASLFQKSALGALEHHISSKMLESKHRSLIDQLDADVGRLLNHNRKRISERIQHIKTQLTELEEMRKKSGDVISHLLEKTRLEQELYLKGVQQFQASREELIAETKLSRRILNKDMIEQLIEENHQEMLDSWTTVGLSAAMKQLFDELRRAMQTVNQESEHIRKAVNNTYQYFDSEFGFNLTPPNVFVPTKFRIEIELVNQILDTFRRSPGMALSRKSVVIRRYRQRMVNPVNALFDQLRTDFERSMKVALQPLAGQIQEHKQMIEKRLENLQRIGRSKDNLQDRMEDAQKQYVDLAKQLTALRNINNSLHYNPLQNGQRTGKPRLVAGRT